MKYLAHLFGGVAALGAGAYLVIYLYRWQWQRAILCGVLLLVVEVLLVGLAVLGRISRLERRIDAGPADGRRQADVLARLRQTDGGRDGAAFTGGRPRFRWLDDPADPGAGRTHVFVPVLMVTGVLLSGLAWLVQRVAEATVRPGAERRLAGSLAPLAAPAYPAAGGGDPVELEHLPLLAPRPTRRRWLLAGGALAGLAVLGALLAGLADLTQTREDHEERAAATSILVRVKVRGDASDGRADLAARQLWERCRDSTSVPLRHAALGDLGDGLYAGVVRPGLGGHDRMRLRGCLEDTGVDRTHFTVLGIGQTDPDDD
ncbi:hypothetical protein RKE29_22220 [Streptomyces sp. B1866]|uniref:hypothetical protein n=1 Tax=Streptomyces sp. B1866 TaxID=3075431 RepID=UPI00289223F4|nr:hypothetical protein [Streptomyces sp. B1866]MDT3399332.1 hypothetical protein [Streptomyces sp. B1866]